MRVWTVSVAHAGTRTQCVGVAALLDPAPRVLLVTKYPRWRVGPLSLYRKLEKPEPDIIISSGRKAARHVFAIAAVCRKRPFTVHLQPPELDFADRFDMIFVGRQNWTALDAARPNTHPMLGTPHEIAREDLLALRDHARSRWLPDGRRAATVLIGGPTPAFAITDGVMERLGKAIGRLVDDGWRLLVSPSRRSPPQLLSFLETLESENVSVWNGAGANPYREFLAAADAFLVTEDSVSMVSEALVTGRPVYTFALDRVPSVKSAKYVRFHHEMSEVLGLTRPFAGELAPYRYEVLNEAPRIAGLIRDALERGESR